MQIATILNDLPMLAQFPDMGQMRDDLVPKFSSLPVKPYIPRYPLLPATLLGRLAVDSTYQGKGIGELVLTDALKGVLDDTRQIASLAVVVEAIDENAVSFYQKCGFRQFKEYPSKLYLLIKSIAT